MTEEEIHRKLTGVFRDVFDEPTLEIRGDTTADDVEAWDSLTHINLIVAVEKAFGVSFTTREVLKLANVGDLLRLIAARVG